MSETFRQWLAGELKQRGMSHTELARQIGLSHSFVSKIVSGAKPPSAKFCNLVATALDVAPAHVLTLAGILPGEPAPTSPGPVTTEIMRLVENLPPELRHFALDVLRLAESLPPEQRRQLLDYARFLSQQSE